VHESLKYIREYNQQQLGIILLCSCKIKPLQTIQTLYTSDVIKQNQFTFFTP